MDPRFANVKWVFFDWGGVIQDEEAGVRDLSQTASRILANRNLSVSADQYYAAFLDAELTGASDKLTTATSRFTSDDVVIENIRFAIEEVDRGAFIFDGVLDIMELIRETYGSGIISNNSGRFEARLQVMGLLPLFKIVVGSTDVGVSKPDPGIFHLALERAGCAAAEAMMVGDRPEKDIAGANRVGMKTVRVRVGWYKDQEPDSDDEIADADITDIRQLPELLL